jgi:glycosyltransferase involved in cell wall biosynthesis
MAFMDHKAMRLLIICAAYPPDIKGGAEISTKLLAEGLSRAGHDVTVLTIAENPRQELIEGVQITRIKTPNIYWSIDKTPGAIEKVRWHIRENHNHHTEITVRTHIARINPDLVITSTTENFGANAWRAAKKLEIPVIHILRNYNTMCTRSALFKNGKNCLTPCPECSVLTVGKKMASQEVDGVIGLSNHVLNAHLEGGFFKTSNPIVLPNFIPDSIMVPRAANFSPRTLRTPPILGYLGTLADLKGVNILMDAYKNTYSKTKARLMIAGDGLKPYVDNMKQELKGYDVEFMGWINPTQVLPHLDFLIIPSLWHEPLGRVVLEAFSYGVPVIGSNRGGIPDMIKEGHNGFLFEPDTAGSLENAITEATQLGEKYESLSQNAFSSLKRFRENVMIKEYEDYFMKVKSSSGQG